MFDDFAKIIRSIRTACFLQSLISDYKTTARFPAERFQNRVAAGEGIEKIFQSVLCHSFGL